MCLGVIQELLEEYEIKKNDKVHKDQINKEFYEIISSYKYSIVYGAGMVTCPCLLKLMKFFNKVPVAITDSDVNKWGNFIEDIPIISLTAIKEQYGTDGLVIIAVKGREEDSYSIGQQLRDAGFGNVMECTEWLKYREGMDLSDYNLMSDSKENEIIKAKESLEKLLYLLEDKESFSEIYEIIKFRLLPYNCNFSYYDYPYFKSSLFDHKRIEHIVDCGAYRGDSLLECLGSLDRWISYYACEMDKINLLVLNKRIQTLPEKFMNKIKVFPYAIYEKDGLIKITEDGSVGSHINKKEGNTMIECRKLDTILRNKKVDYIKMDMEGAEASALKGGIGLIRKNKPILVISLYHNDKDLWEIPLYISENVENYHYYIRREGLAEYILIAVPGRKHF